MLGAASPLSPPNALSAFHASPSSDSNRTCPFSNVAFAPPGSLSVEGIVCVSPVVVSVILSSLLTFNLPCCIPRLTSFALKSLLLYGIPFSSTVPLVNFPLAFSLSFLNVSLPNCLTLLPPFVIRVSTSFGILTPAVSAAADAASP